MLHVTKFQPHEGEKIIFVARRHKFIFYPKIVVPAFVLTLSITAISAYLINIKIIQDWLDRSFLRMNFDPLWIVGVISFIFIIISIIKIWNLYIDWKYDNLVLTTQRLVEVDQHFLFAKDTSSVSLEDIVNVKAHYEGIINSLVRIGTIVIETASASTRDIVFQGVGSVENLEERIHCAREAYKLALNNGTSPDAPQGIA